VRGRGCERVAAITRVGWIQRAVTSSRTLARGVIVSVGREKDKEGA
jgi:hypothetical protein